MENMAITAGIDHVGVTVKELGVTSRFFVECLGWKVVGERPEYPAAFISDGTSVLTLWQAKPEGSLVEFDRHQNIGLHHLAFKIGSEAELSSLMARIQEWPGVIIEFMPEPSGGGPKIHAMIREPGGLRIELAWDPR